MFLKYSVFTVVLAILLAFLAAWLLGASLLAENAGRAVLGDQFYASWPITRSQCAFGALICLVSGALVLVLGRSKSQSTSRSMVANRNRWPTVKLVEEIRLQPNLIASRNDAADVFSAMAHTLRFDIDNSMRVVASKSNGFDKNEIDGRFIAPRGERLEIVWRRHEAVEKWKCFEVRVDGNAQRSGIAIVVRFSVALHDQTDRTVYPQQASPVSLYENDRLRYQQSSSTQGSSSSEYFVNYVLQPASNDFQFWCEQHPDEYSFFSNIRLAVIDSLTSFAEDRKNQPPTGKLPGNV